LLEESLARLGLEEFAFLIESMPGEVDRSEPSVEFEREEREEKNCGIGGRGRDEMTGVEPRRASA
jgi:hypothetical protein